MKHVKITSFDIPSSWYDVNNVVYREGEIFKVGYGSETTETKKLNLTAEILHPEIRPLLHEKAPTDMSYVNLYALQYLWLGEKSPGEDYTYGERGRKPVDQISEAVKRYTENKNDRQVTIVIRRPEDIFKIINGKVHHPPCLTIIDTEILDNQMHLTTYFRSWDAYAGYPCNIAGLQIFNEAFVNEINELGQQQNRDWEVVGTGKIISHSKNIHIYERQYSRVEKLLQGHEDVRRSMMKRTTKD